MRKKLLLLLIATLGLCLTACGKTENTSAHSDTGAVESVSEDSTDNGTEEIDAKEAKETENKEDTSVSTAGDIEIRFSLYYDDSKAEITDAAATISYLPQTIDTGKLIEPQFSRMRANSVSTYPSIEHINEIRAFGIGLYNKLVLPYTDTYREEFNTMHLAVANEEDIKAVSVANLFKDEVTENFGSVEVKGLVTDAYLSKGDVVVPKDSPKRMESMELAVTLTIDDKASLINYVNEIMSEDESKKYEYTEDDEGSITTLLTIPDSSSSAETSGDSSDSSKSEDTGVFGRWIPSYSEMYYCLELNSNCTGTLYRGNKTYPLTFVINGNKINVTVDFDGSAIKSQYFYEDNTLVSDQDNTIFTRE